MHPDYMVSGEVYSLVKKNKIMEAFTVLRGYLEKYMEWKNCADLNRFLEILDPEVLGRILSNNVLRITKEKKNKLPAWRVFREEMWKAYPDTRTWPI